MSKVVPPTQSFPNMGFPGIEDFGFVDTVAVGIARMAGTASGDFRRLRRAAMIGHLSARSSWGCRLRFLDFLVAHDIRSFNRN